MLLFRTCDLPLPGLGMRRFVPTLLFALVAFCTIGEGQSQEPAKAAAGPIEIIPAPADANDLSMEVAALRTLYLLKAGRDQSGERPAFVGVKRYAKDSAETRKRRPGEISKNYQKVLVDLRAAFIANQEDRINELSDQLDELAKDEDPDLDDAIELTDGSRKRCQYLLRYYFEATRIAGYVASYGKDFPDPYMLIVKTLKRREKPTPEEWKLTRDFVIKEVSWQIGGLEVAQQQKTSVHVARMLDRGYRLGGEAVRKELEDRDSALHKEFLLVLGDKGPTDVIKHVVEQDVAELLANPRCVPAVEAREDYLAKVAAAKKKAAKKTE
jgi:hypothetical protein